jgi:hypothetical protein
MVAIYGVAIGLTLGWLRGGQLSELRNLRLRLGWVVLPAALLQLLVVTDPWAIWREPGMAGLLLMISYAPFVAFIAANPRVPGLAVAGIGLALNLVVMLANGGLMPVSPQSQLAAGHPEDREIIVGARTSAGKGIILPASETRLAFLSDTIVMPPFPRPMIVSLGDLVMVGGLAYGVHAAMRRRKTGSVVQSATAVVSPSHPV